MPPVPAKTLTLVQNGVGKGWGKGGYGLIFAIKGLENGGILWGGGLEPPFYILLPIFLIVVSSGKHFIWRRGVFV